MRAHRAAVEAQIPELADLNVVLESEPRESSAAIGLAAAILHHREPDVIIGADSERPIRGWTAETIDTWPRRSND